VKIAIINAMESDKRWRQNEIIMGLLGKNVTRILSI
jgi:hypothetical protein